MLQNSFPIWEDFNMKAGRMHAALRLVAMSSFCLEVLGWALKKAVWRRKVGEAIPSVIHRN